MKKIILTIITVLLCLGILGGGIAGIIKLTDGSMDVKKISSTKFTVGGLDTNGKYMNTNASIYTKDAFECQGLEVSLDFDNTVDYQIYFYDQNNDFVHTTGKLSVAFVKDSVPFFAKYARIVVTPKEDDVVTALEVSKYAKQLSIKVNREQGFKNYTENLFTVYKTATKLDTTTGLETTEGEDTHLRYVSDFVNVTGYKEALLIRANNQLMDISPIIFYDNNKNFVKAVMIRNCSVQFEASTGYYYYIDLQNVISSDYTYVRLSGVTAQPIEMYCR